MIFATPDTAALYLLNVGFVPVTDREYRSRESNRRIRVVPTSGGWTIQHQEAAR